MASHIQVHSSPCFDSIIKTFKFGFRHLNLVPLVSGRFWLQIRPVHTPIYISGDTCKRTIHVQNIESNKDVFIIYGSFTSIAHDTYLECESAYSRHKKWQRKKQKLIFAGHIPVPPKNFNLLNVVKNIDKNQTNLVINYFTLNQPLPLVSGSGLTFRNCTGSLFAKRQTILQTVWKSILSAFLKLKLFMFTVSIYNHFIFSFDNFSFLFLLFSFLSPSPSFIQKQVNTLVSSIPTILPQYRTWFVFLWTRNTFIFSILTPSFFPFLFLSFCSWFIF